MFGRIVIGRYGYKSSFGANNCTNWVQSFHISCAKAKAKDTHVKRRTIVVFSILILVLITQALDKCHVCSIVNVTGTPWYTKVDANWATHCSRNVLDSIKTFLKMEVIFEKLQWRWQINLFAWETVVLVRKTSRWRRWKGTIRETVQGELGGRKSLSYSFFSSYSFSSPLFLLILLLLFFLLVFPPLQPLKGLRRLDFSFKLFL